MDEESHSTSPFVITIEDLEKLSSDKSESSIQKLKSQLDSLVEQDDWEEELLVESDPELTDIILYSASGYLCRKLLKFTKCQVCRDSFLTKVETSNLAVAELVNAKTKGFLLHCNLFLFEIFRKTEFYFQKNVTSSDVYEKTLCDVFENINLTFPCDLHKSEVLAEALHYYILMRMRQYERERNRSCKKKSRSKKKQAKLCTS